MSAVIKLSKSKLASPSPSPRSKDEPYVRRETIPSTRAEDMLLKNAPFQRPMTPRIITMFAHDMSEGKFLFTGDSIKLNKDGFVLDGQKRLSACVKSGVPLDTLVVYNLPDEIFDKLDIGQKRKASDALRRAGFPNVSSMATTARWLCIIKNGGPHIHSNRSVNDTDITSMACRHSKLMESIRYCHGAKFSGRIGLLMAIHYLGHLINKPVDADNFVRCFKEAVHIYPNDAAIAWREHVIRTRRDEGATADGCVVYANLVTAWNLHAAKKGVHINQWKLCRNPDVTIDGLDVNLL